MHKIKLNESVLRQIVSESVRRILKEDFSNTELTNLVREHGGLVSTDELVGRYGARSYESWSNIANMRPVGYINPEEAHIIDMFNTFKPINEQILYCNDGGVIVVEGTERYENLDDMLNDPNRDKMHKRLNNYLDDKGEKPYPYVGVDKYSNRQRREDHMNRRGVKTTGPNAGKKTKKKNKR